MSTWIHIATVSTSASPPDTLVRRSAARRPAALQKVRTDTGAPKRGKASTLIRARRTTHAPRSASAASTMSPYAMSWSHRAIASRRTRPDPVASASPGATSRSNRRPRAGGGTSSVDGIGELPVT